MPTVGGVVAGDVGAASVRRRFGILPPPRLSNMTFLMSIIMPTARAWLPPPPPALTRCRWTGCAEALAKDDIMPKSSSSESVSSLGGAFLDSRSRFFDIVCLGVFGAGCSLLAVRWVARAALGLSRHPGRGYPPHARRSLRASASVSANDMIVLATSGCGHGRRPALLALLASCIPFRAAIAVGGLLLPTVDTIFFLFTASTAC